MQAVCYRLEAVLSQALRAFVQFWLACLIFLSPLVVSAQVAAPASLLPLRVDFVEAQLIADVVSVQPGGSFKAGLRLKHDAHWHTYWKNPGDSGLPTQLSWALPSGWEAGPVQWPTPERIGVAHLANYGFEGEIVLPVTIRVPANATGIARLEVSGNWLACKDVCIPAEARLAIALPVQGTAAAASPSAVLFAAMDKISPQGAPLKAQVFAPIGKVQTIKLPSPLSADLLNQAKKIEFFPATEAWINPASVQSIAIDGPSLRLDLTLGDNPTKPNVDLGVLQIDQKFFALSLVDGQGDAGVAPVARWTSKVEKLVDMSPSASKLYSQSPASGLPQSVGNVAVQNASTFGFWAALGLAFVGGLLLNLMPCVLPVLSIKLLGLMHSGAARNRDGWLYGLGVVLSFLSLGLALWLFRSAGQTIGWGFQLQSPTIVASLAVVFLLLSLNLMGVFELGTHIAQLASPTHTATSDSQGAVDKHRSSALGAVGSGVLAVVAASPCSAPFMGSAVGYALSQPVPETLAIFVALGVGMALPFVAVTQLPNLSKWIPKPGAWMVAFKQVLAFPLLATVAWLVWVFGQQTSVDALFKLLLAFVGVAWLAWLWGRKQYGYQKRPLLAALTAICLVALCGWLIISASQMQDDEAASLSEPPFKEPTGSTQSSSGGAGTTWQKYSPELLEQSLAAGKPVFIDFTAAWCVSCQVNKKAVLETDATREFFVQKKVVLLRADWTKRDRQITQALASYGRNSIPVYAVYRAGQRQVQLLPEVLTSAVVQAAF